MSEKFRIASCKTLREAASLLHGEPEVFVVCDRNVEWVAWEAGTFVGAVSIDTSESLKTMGTVMEICKWLLENNATRDALLLAVGGGITTDLAGFAAAIYKRGIRYANLPTTLLAQVDAAIGGKTGVNFLEYKNMLGAFRMPEFTAICPEVLRTLPPRQYKAGLAEMLKTFIIADESAYNQALSGVTGELIIKAASIKESIVERDPLEKGERAVLNLGHTFAHAIEHKALEAGDDILHGEAVAIGIIMAAEMSEREGIAEKGLTARLTADFRSLHLPTECPYSSLETAMIKDKKATGADKVKLVLPVKIGEVVVKEYDLHLHTE